MTQLPILLVILGNAIALVLGAIITHLILRAVDRTGDSSLRYLAYGFGLVTASLFFGGGVHAVLGIITYGVAVREILTAVGLGLVLYSLWMRDRQSNRTVQAERSDS